MLAAGVYDHHLRKARRHYHGRRDLLVQSIVQQIPQTAIQGIAAGIQLVMSLPADVSEAAVTAAATQHDMSVWELESFYTERHTTPPSLVLGYRLVPDAGRPKASVLLAKAIEAAHHTAILSPHI